MSALAKRSMVAWVYAGLMVVFAAQMVVAGDPAPPVTGNPGVDFIAWAWTRGPAFVLAAVLGWLALEIRGLYKADLKDKTDEIKRLQAALDKMTAERIAEMRKEHT